MTAVSATWRRGPVRICHVDQLKTDSWICHVSRGTNKKLTAGPIRICHVSQGTSYVLPRGPIRIRRKGGGAETCQKWAKKSPRSLKCFFDVLTMSWFWCDFDRIKAGIVPINSQRFDRLGGNSTLLFPRLTATSPLFTAIITSYEYEYEVLRGRSPCPLRNWKVQWWSAGFGTYDRHPADQSRVIKP